MALMCEQKSIVLSCKQTFYFPQIQKPSRWNVIKMLISFCGCYAGARWWCYRNNIFLPWLVLWMSRITLKRKSERDTARVENNEKLQCKRKRNKKKEKKERKKRKREREREREPPIVGWVKGSPCASLFYFLQIKPNKYEGIQGPNTEAVNKDSLCICDEDLIGLIVVGLPIGLLEYFRVVIGKDLNRLPSRRIKVSWTKRPICFVKT